LKRRGKGGRKGREREGRREGRRRGEIVHIQDYAFQLVWVL